MGSITQGGIAFGQGMRERRNKKEAKQEKRDKFDLVLAKAGVVVDQKDFEGMTLDQADDLKLTKLAEATKSALDATMEETKLDLMQKRINIRNSSAPNLKDMVALGAIDTVEKSLNEEGKRSMAGNFFDKITPWHTEFEGAKKELKGVPDKEFRDKFKKRFDEVSESEKAPSSAPEGISQEDWDKATEAQKQDHLKGV